MEGYPTEYVTKPKGKLKLPMFLLVPLYPMSRHTANRLRLTTFNLLFRICAQNFSSDCPVLHLCPDQVDVYRWRSIRSGQREASTAARKLLPTGACSYYPNLNLWKVEHIDQPGGGSYALIVNVSGHPVQSTRYVVHPKVRLIPLVSIVMPCCCRNVVPWTGGSRGSS
jgi:hypothetical protein